jgi:hypothetical protein
MILSRKLCTLLRSRTSFDCRATYVLVGHCYSCG